MNEQIIIRGTQGILIVNSTTGYVDKVIPNSFEEDCSYFDIVIFDITEYRARYGKVHNEIDILDIGYWVQNGKEFVEPDFKYRELIDKGIIDSPDAKEGLQKDVDVVEEQTSCSPITSLLSR